MKPIFRTDLMMALLFVASIYSGFEIHYAGHFQSHEVWHNWSVVHVVANVLFLVISIIHIKQHWNWYKSLIKRTSSKKPRIVTILLSLLFATTILSSIYLLLFAKGEGTSAGFFHYVVGIIFGVLSIGHFVKRWKVLKKSISKA